jgi:hypothetical protein
VLIARVQVAVEAHVRQPRRDCSSLNAAGASGRRNRRRKVTKRTGRTAGCTAAEYTEAVRAAGPPAPRAHALRGDPSLTLRVLIAAGEESLEETQFVLESETRRRS